jgi:hypothetical protein
MAGAAKVDHPPALIKARVFAAIMITIATNPKRPERPPPFARYAPRAMTPNIKRIMPRLLPSIWLIKYSVVVTKRDHASNSVVGLGWGINVDHMVNSPEIGRAISPIRIQLVVFSDEDDVILSNSLPSLVFEFLLVKGGELEIQTPKSSHLPVKVTLLRSALA